MTVSFERTAKALDVRDAASEAKVTMIEMQQLNRIVAESFADDTAEFNDRETVLGLFNAAPPPFVRACVAQYRFPSEVARLIELGKKVNAEVGLSFYWYEIIVPWLQRCELLYEEERAEFRDLIVKVGLHQNLYGDELP